MSIMSWIDLAFCVRLVVTLGHFLWQATAIAALAWLAGALLSGATSRSRYGVLVLALLAMAACPVVTYVFVAGSTVPSSPALPTIAPSATNDTMSQVSVEPPETASSGQGDHAGDEIAATQRPVEAPYGAWRALAAWLTVFYFAGVLGMLVRLLLALHGGRRLGLASEPAGDAGILATTAARAKAMGLHVAPAVAYCRRVTVPTVVGVLRPMILLPASLVTGLTTEQIEAILTHELAHIRRYDHLVNLLQRVIESALFFHPAVWCVSRLIRAERENCCDDLAVAIGGERYVYASSLVRVGEICLCQRNAAGLAGAATLAAADRPCQLRRRIVRLFGGGTAHERIRLLRDWPMALVLPILVIMAASLLISAKPKPAGPPPAQPAAATLEKWLAGKDVVQVRFKGPHIKPQKILDFLKVKAADNDRTFRMMAVEMATGYSYVKVCMKVSPENTRKLLSIQKQLRAISHRPTPANTRVWSLAGDPNARAKARKMAPKVLAAANAIRTALPNAQTKAERPRAEWYLGGITCKAPGLTKTVYIKIHEITAMMKWHFDPSFAEQTIHLPRMGLVVTTYHIPTDVLPPARTAIRKAVNQAVAPLLKLEGDTVRRREEMLPPPDRLKVRLALLEQAERKDPLRPEAWLYVKNAGGRTINLPRSNHTGRKMKSVYWSVGLSIEVRMPDGKIRSYSYVDESDPTYWSTIRFGPRKTMHTKPIDAGQQIRLVINLRDLTDSQGAKLTSLKGTYSLRPVLTTAGAAGKWWLGSSTGPWIAVKIGKQPGMAGKMPVFFTPAGRKPAAATQPAKAFKASFETLSVEITSTWTWNRTITIKGDGSYTFHPHNSQRLKKAP
ncbi:MAG: M56 family metallopeptidase, partial [Phycisphaerae bacterium]|nr:M56 family metallopeptidase [Phycisphaerae bacterium]